MNTQGLALLVHAPDLDYVSSFQNLASVNLEIRSQGPTAPRLLRRAILEVDVGDFAGAKRSAEASLDLDQDLGEAHFQRGVACTLLALVKADAVPGGPGHADMPQESMRLLLKEAAASFGEALRCNPEDDEVEDRVVAIGEILDAASTEEQVAAILRGDPDDAATEEAETNDA